MEKLKLKADYEEHGPYCNCEDCWWENGQKEICPTCGCIVGEGCPGTHLDKKEDIDNINENE